jgi:NAD(P)-dependent dehydrogenase (short-subunit alcohol dehydrogenase family)
MPKTVLVTGAASGIGLASAKLLLQEGYQVMAFDPQEELMRHNLPEEDLISFFCGDISMSEDCSDAVALTVKTFGQLDALLHWGAAHSSKRWDELDAEEFNHIMSVNVTGSFLIAQAAARYMMAGDGGAIVLTTSTSVIFGATGGNGQGGPAYVSSKGAIIALNRSLARALAPKVRCNAVSPGLTETPMIGGMTKKLREDMTRRFPLGRFGIPDEIANAGLFLISEKASFITGEVIHVNGGSNFN